MPYIKQNQREELWSRSPETAGELNFFITLKLHEYIQLNGDRYQAHNDVLGIVELAKDKILGNCNNSTHVFNAVVEDLFTVLSNYLMSKNHSEQAWVDVRGVLRGIELEFYRRKTAIYEDGVIQRNGDL